jgi:hypothetical protein
LFVVKKTFNDWNLNKDYLEDYLDSKNKKRYMKYIKYL